MAKRRKKKKNATNPRRRRRSAKKNPARRRYNPGSSSSSKPSTMSVVGGVLVGALIAGSLDYGLSGMEATATPTRRAIIGGVLGVVSVGAGIKMGGTAGGLLMGTGASLTGVAGANGARALSLAMTAAKDAKPKTDAGAKYNADGTMKGLVRGAPLAALMPGRRAGAPNMRGVVLTDKNRMRALIRDV